METLVLALDLGTSSVRALVYDAAGHEVAGTKSQVEHTMRTTPDGGAEFDALTLLREVESCVDQTLAGLRDARSEAPPLSAVAISQLVTNLLGVDAGLDPVTPVYTYADTRSAAHVEELRAQVDELAIHQRTGCRLHTSYWPARFLWLQQTQPAVRARSQCWVSFGEFLLLRLFGRALCSASVASWTGLLDRHTMDWDEHWLHLLGVQHGKLSPIAGSKGSFIGLTGDYAERWPELKNARWFAPISDGVASNIGSGCVDGNRVALSVGTSGAMRVVVDHQEKIPASLWFYRIDEERCLTGGALNDAGNIFAWLRNTLKLHGSDLESQLSFLPPDEHGLTILPFLTGERSPGWNPRAQFVLMGATPDTAPLEVLQAGLEAVALRFAAVFDEMRPFARAATQIIASGGGLLHSPAWTQIMADALGQPITASAEPDPSARGAALLALEALGVLRLEQATAALGQTFEPNAENFDRYRAALTRQQELYRRLFA